MKTSDLFFIVSCIYLTPHMNDVVAVVLGIVFGIGSIWLRRLEESLDRLETQDR